MTRARTCAKNPDRAERSAFFARREAANVLRTVLRGDAKQRSLASIRSLIYSPSIKNKKATFALVCQTLKYLPLIKEILETSISLNSKWKRQEELVYVVTYDIIFGVHGQSFEGDAEKYLTRKKESLTISLAKLLVKHKLKNLEELTAVYQKREMDRPCFLRVNTLKTDVATVLLEFGDEYEVREDDVVPDLLVLPSRCDLHKHPLVLNGSVFIQGKGSTMAALALDPKPGSVVLDACAAPGNKTAHIAALMRGSGRVIACELNEDRIGRLEDTVMLSGAHNIEVLHDDFLKLNPNDPKFANVSYILVDPSCSGSGTVAQRLDYLLPSHGGSAVDAGRLRKLAAFQRKALAHALSFPAVERVVYSTCSVNKEENEEVVAAVATAAKALGFRLAAALADWPRRGAEGYEDSTKFVRLDPEEDREGFFIALFIKNGDSCGFEKRASKVLSFTKLSRVLIFANMAGNFK